MHKGTILHTTALQVLLVVHQQAYKLTTRLSMTQDNPNQPKKTIFFLNFKPMSMLDFPLFTTSKTKTRSSQLQETNSTSWLGLAFNRRHNPTL